jgi:D-alanyl-D-alanine dipeptidase
MHIKAQQQQQTRPPSAASTGVPLSVLIESQYRPKSDVMPLDAKQDHWQLLHRDVSTAQRALSEAVASEHSRCPGVDTLHTIKHNMKNENKKLELAAVLAEIQQVSTCCPHSRTAAHHTACMAAHIWPAQTLACASCSWFLEVAL